VFECPEAKRAGIGQARKDDIWKAVGWRLKVEGSDLVQLELDFWSGDRIDQRLLDFALSLRSRYKTAILSNAWPEARRMLENKYKVTPYFDLIMISAEERVAKPDPAIYQAAARRLGVRPQECVFVDDFPENIQGALQAGMQAVQFMNTDQVLAELKALLV
jgi:putative hydrolase of the HAD superfamily